MQEQQVTADGVSRPLPRPFLVLATQNPIEYEGTFPLPEAQLDRFLMRISMGYLSVPEERRLLVNLRAEHPIHQLKPVAECEELFRLQKEIWGVHIDETLEEYIVRLVSATRAHPDLSLGASPRASLALYKTSQALAAIRGRDHVQPEDVRTLVPFVMTHRLILRAESEIRGRTAAMVVRDLLEATPLDLGQAE
jgi:MoxR-like ATPase